MFCFTVLFIQLLKQNFGRSCEAFSILEDEVKSSKKIVQSLLHEQNKLIPGAVECLENSEIIKSKLDSDLGEHINFSDIDPMVMSDNQIQAKTGIIVDCEGKSLFEPYWSFIPLNNNNSAEDQSSKFTFDRYQVDSLVDIGYNSRQYEHPLILKHYQVLLVPSNLFALLQKEAEKIK